MKQHVPGEPLNAIDAAILSLLHTDSRISNHDLAERMDSLTELKQFLRKTLTPIATVAQVTSSIALRPVVYRTALPTARSGPPHRG